MFRILDKLFAVIVAIACLLVVLAMVIPRRFGDKRPRVYFAAEAGDTNYLAQYLALGSNVNSSIVCYKNGHRYAPLLQIAVLGGHPDAVDFLLQRGADPNQFDSSGDPPLRCAIGRDRGEASSQIVRGLIKAGAKPNLPYGSEFHYTPLIDAASLGQTEMVGILLAEGADVRGSNKIGQTALHLAGRHAEVAKMLLAAGADPNTRDVDGASPIDYAMRDGYTNTLPLLTNAPFPRNH